MQPVSGDIKHLTSGAQDVSLLMAFASVMETGSFAAAARKLGFSASAISQKIGRLEQVTGLELFERHAKRVEPTHNGRLLYPRVVEMLRAASKLSAEVHSLASGEAGELRVGSFASASREICAPSIARFMASLPEIEVNLIEDEPDVLLPMVADSKLDLALVFAYDNAPIEIDKSLEAVPLTSEPQLAIVSSSHRLATETSVSFDDLLTEKWITTQPETLAVQGLTARCAQAGVRPKIVFHSTNYAAVQGLVRAGLGVALVPRLAFVPDEGICVLDLGQPPMKRYISAVVRAAERDGPARSLLKILRDVTSKLILAQP